MVRIPHLDHCASIVCPSIIAVPIQIVPKIPSDIRKSPKPRNRISNKPLFIFTTCVRVNATIVHVQNQRNDNVSVSCKAECSFKFLPVRGVKMRVVESRMKNIFGLLSRPGCNVWSPVGATHNRFSVKISWFVQRP